MNEENERDVQFTACVILTALFAVVMAVFMMRQILRHSDALWMPLFLSLAVFSLIGAIQSPTGKKNQTMCAMLRCCITLGTVAMLLFLKKLFFGDEAQTVTNVVFGAGLALAVFFWIFDVLRPSASEEDGKQEK